MGILSRKKAKPAFVDPEVPLEPVNKGSIFNRFRASVSFESPADPNTGLTHGATQTTFLGKNITQPIVPAFARKASLAKAEKDKEPSHLRYGETDNDLNISMDRAFFMEKLTMDAASDDGSDSEIRRDVLRQWGDRKAKGRAGDWNTNLGWDQPKRKPGKNNDKKRRSKRAQRALDEDLDAFNQFAQNGLTSLKRVKMVDETAATSLTSLNTSKFDDYGTTNDDSTSMLLPDDEDGHRKVLVGDGFDAVDVMADHIYRIGVQKKKWFKPPRLGDRRHGVGTGVSIRVKTGLYRTYPVRYKALDSFEEAVTKLNPEVAIKIRSDMVTNIMRTYILPSPSMTELVIDDNTRIQILDTVPLLGRARKHQYAAFIRDERVLCVWADHVDAVIPAAEALEEALMDFIWRGESENKKNNQVMVMDEELEAKSFVLESTAIEPGDPEDLVDRKIRQHWKERPTMLWAPISDGLAIMMCFTVVSLGLRTLVKEYALDGQAMRFVLAIFCFPLFLIVSFACICVMGSVFQIFGPIRQFGTNSASYSGIAPKRTMGELSHVTVQLPVYKESLDDVIRPTVESLKKAITTYERQGGSVGILVCDDGLQLLSQEEADERRRFYFDNNIAYVARPGHDVDGFQRKGRFKKAGNMNFANALSLRVEEIMDELRPDAAAEKGDGIYWNNDDESNLYERALAQAVEESEGKAWAAGNIRFGPIILIIDSDTRVPEDCFADAVSEMAESPEVAIIQHVSGVMQVANHFFENGIAFFTRSINTAISFVTSSGEIAPFVGHNAFIRWSALQECMHPDPDNGKMRVWSEEHVSEDFQIAIALQVKGYVIRWASYSKGEFQEGVSLTCDDELNRWQKYAFGCSELVFNPLRQWLFRGPITPLFRTFLWSNIPIHSKFTVCSYIFSYTAIACAWFLTCANVFIKGWDLNVDAFYLPSWYVTLVCIVLFGGICNLGYIVLQYRLKMPDCSRLAFDRIIWIPFFTIFFSGMSMPVSFALVAHPFGYNMTWSATVKSVQKSNFFLQIPLIWKRFWPQLCFFGVWIPGLIILTSSLVPEAYKIKDVTVIVPIAMVLASHILWPFALNPWFLSFSF